MSAFVEGQMASDFLRDPITSCKGKKACLSTCFSKEQEMTTCSVLYSCRNDDFCNNINTLEKYITEPEDGDIAE